MYSLPTNYKERPVVIVGAGTLGMRIALMMATQGGEIRLVDNSAEQKSKAKTFIEKQLPVLLEKSLEGCKGSIILCSTLEEAVKDAWIVFEAVPEQLDLKIKLFGMLDQLAAPDAILASNSSSFPSSLFISQVSTSGRNRVVNTHFYMPPLQKAVEIMSCGFTDRSIITTLIKLLPRYGGLVPFHVQKESVGFIFNRVWAAIKRECLEVVASGISTPEDVDRIFYVNTGVNTGPFREMDQIGLDVVLQIEEHYAALNPALPSGPRELLRKYVAEGKLGIKSGCGFYSYEKPKTRN
jgi:3-hydroxybutyryl-CoA dehydrogenase